MTLMLLTCAASGLPSSEVALWRELLNAKDEVVRKTEEVVRAKDETMRIAEEAAHLKLQLERAAMRNVMNETARTVEGVKLRAMVEYLAKTHGDSRGAQNGLNAVFASDAQLRAVADAFSTEFKLLQVDLERNVGGLYHSLSKELHGSESRVEVREAHWRSSTERAVLCALLERFCVTYAYVDAGGQVVPSPYAAPAKRVLGGGGGEGWGLGSLTAVAKLTRRRQTSTNESCWS